MIGSSLVFYVDAVCAKRVEVDVQIQTRARSVDAGHGVSAPDRTRRRLGYVIPG